MRAPTEPGQYGETVHQVRGFAKHITVDYNSGVSRQHGTLMEIVALSYARCLALRHSQYIVCWQLRSPECLIDIRWLAIIVDAQLSQ